MAQRGNDGRPLDIVEFVQTYPNNVQVWKRGVDATLAVIRQHRIGPNEVMAFSCAEKRGRAITAFHFHPGFPWEDRAGYMRAHDEGRVLADAERIEAEAALRRRREAMFGAVDAWRERLRTRGFGRVAAAAAVVVAVLAQIAQIGPPR